MGVNGIRVQNWEKETSIIKLGGVDAESWGSVQSWNKVTSIMTLGRADGYGWGKFQNWRKGHQPQFLLTVYYFFFEIIYSVVCHCILNWSTAPITLIKIHTKRSAKKCAALESNVLSISGLWILKNFIIEYWEFRVFEYWKKCLKEYLEYRGYESGYYRRILRIWGLRI